MSHLLRIPLRFPLSLTKGRRLLFNAHAAFPVSSVSCCHSYPPSQISLGKHRRKSNSSSIQPLKQFWMNWCNLLFFTTRGFSSVPKHLPTFSSQLFCGQPRPTRFTYCVPFIFVKNPARFTYNCRLQLGQPRAPPGGQEDHEPKYALNDPSSIYRQKPPPKCPASCHLSEFPAAR